MGGEERSKECMGVKGEVGSIERPAWRDVGIIIQVNLAVGGAMTRWSIKSSVKHQVFRAVEQEQWSRLKWLMVVAGQLNASKWNMKAQMKLVMVMW